MNERNSNKNGDKSSNLSICNKHFIDILYFILQKDKEIISVYQQNMILELIELKRPTNNC